MKVYRVNVVGLFDNNEFLICSTLEEKDVFECLAEIFPDRIGYYDIDWIPNNIDNFPYKMVLSKYNGVPFEAYFNDANDRNVFMMLMNTWMRGITSELSEEEKKRLMQ